MDQLFLVFRDYFQRVLTREVVRKGLLSRCWKDCILYCIRSV